MIYTKKLKLLFIVLITSFIAKAGEIRIVGDSIVTLDQSAIAEANDPKFIDMQTSGWQNDFSSSNVVGIIAFGIDKNTLQNQFVNFSTSIKIDVIYETQASGGPVTLSNQVLNLNYDPINISTSEVVIKIPNAHKIKAVIIDAPTSTGLTLYLKAEIILNRSYNFNRSALPSPLTIGKNVDANLNTLTFTWDSFENAEEYDLEWAHYGNSDGTPSGLISASSLTLPENPFQQASRVSTKVNHYTIPLLFDKGYLIFRVRGKGKMYQDNYNYLYEGKWSCGDCTADDVDDFGDFLDISTYGHESDKNWNYQAVFTEGGNNKYSLTYSDGSGRARQTVVNQNDKNETVVAETYYDYQGRPVIQALPTPTANPEVKYYDGFNLSPTTGLPYSKADFDELYIDDDDCETTVVPFSTTNFPSTGNYYSNNNPSVAVNEDMYVPNAYGYPFSQTIYTNDNTGRVKASTIPGKGFEKGAGKETKYLYTTPYQEELDALFGTNVGLAHKYKKNVVFDANSQASITYINPADQTIATVLTGNGVGSNNTTLESYNVEPEFYWVDLLTKELNSDPIGLLEKIDYGKGVREFSRGIPILKKGVQQVSYAIANEKYSPLCYDDPPIKCYECVVDVEITMKDECGKEYLKGVENPANNNYTLNASAGSSSNCVIPTDTFRSVWASNYAGVGDFQLEVGAYSLSKIITIDYDKLDVYTEDFITGNECLKTKEAFKTAEYEKLEALYNCKYSCSQCVIDLGINYGSSLLNESLPDCDPCINEYEYDQLMKQCLSNCLDQNKCQINFQMLLSDMSPGGQYGLTSDQSKLSADGVIINSNNKFQPNKFPLSIFNEMNQLPLRELFVASGGKQFFNPSWNQPIKIDNDGIIDDSQITHYLNYDGTPLKVYLVNNNDGSYSPEINGTAFTDSDGFEYVYAKDLKNVKDFIDYWRPEWAELLVAYHPEFGSYQYCTLNESSNTFDQELINADPFENLDGAYASVFSISDGNSTGSTPFFTIIDPFFKTNNNPYSQDEVNLVNAFRDKLNNYATNGTDVLSIWDIAWRLGNCDNPGCDDNCSIPDPIVIDNNSWPHFRAMYLAAKDQIVNIHRTSKVINNNLPNSPGNILSSYNGCIGNDNFNKYKFNFLATTVVTIQNGNNSVWGRIKKAFGYQKTTTVNVNDPSSAYFQTAQPCSRSTYHLYGEKDKRFGNDFTSTNNKTYQYEPVPPSSITSSENPFELPESYDNTMAIMEETKTLAQVERFKKCGQCPLAYDLELFLNGIIKNENYNLSDNLINVHCNIKELTPDLNIYLSSDPNDLNTEISTDLVWSNTSGGADELNINIGFHGNNGCAIVFPDLFIEIGKNYDEIDEICCIRGITSNSFEFTVKYTSNDGVKEELTLVGTGCLDLLNCDFGNQCNTNELGSGLQDMLNALVNRETNSSVKDLFSTPTIELKKLQGVDINFYEAMLTKSVIDYFENSFGATIANGLTYNLTSSPSATSELNGVFKVPGNPLECEISLTRIGNSTAALNTIKYFYNLRSNPDLESNHTFLINAITTSNTIIELKGVTCMPVINCRPYLDLSSLSTAAWAKNENCEETELFNGLSSSLKSVTDWTVEGTNNSDGTKDILFYLAGETASDCTVHVEIVESQQEIDFSHIENVITTFVREIVTENNVMYASVQLCDDPAIALCDGSVAIIKITSSCGNVFECKPLNPDNQYKGNCSIFGVVDEIKNNFQTSFLANYTTMVETNGQWEIDWLVDFPVYLQKGREFSTVGSTVLSLSELFKDPVNTGGGGVVTNYITGLHDLYVEREPTGDGLLLSIYLICTTTDGTLVSFELTTLSNNPFGECDECVKPNLIVNGDFDYRNENPLSLSPFSPSFNMPQPTNVESRNYLSNGSNTPPYVVEYTVVTYNNYFKNLYTEPSLSFSPTWNNQCTTTDPDKLIHSSISTEATKSMTGNFLLARINNDLSTPLPVFKQIVTIGSSTLKNYELSLDAFSYLDDDHIFNPTCIPQFEVSINGLPQPYLTGKFNNLYPIWQDFHKPCTPYNTGTTTVKSQHVNDKWSIPWENFKIDFQSANSTIEIEIGVVGVGNSQNCGNQEYYYWGFDNITVREKCNVARYPNFCHANVTDKIYIQNPANECEAEIEFTAEYNAKLLYRNYMDSVKLAFRDGYVKKCLNVYDDFKLNFEEDEHHYTLYYYDQAGNLVRTVPPKGVSKLPYSGLAKVKLDRKLKQKATYTEHTMATTYQYNSLGQLIQQSVPDHDDLDIYESNYVPNANSGLPSDFFIRDVAFTNSLEGVLVGFRDLSGGGREGLIFKTNDGGTTWNEATSYGTDNYNYIDDYGNVVGAGGSLLLKVGSNYNKKSTPTNENLIFKTTELDLDHFKIFSESGKFWETFDHGDSWSTANSALKSKTVGLIAKYDVDGNGEGIAVSSSGQIFRTTNFGVNWTVSNIISSGALTSVANLGGKFILVGKNGLLHEYNNAASISDIQESIDGDFEFIKSIGGNLLYGVDEDAQYGPGKSISKSSDGGTTWSTILSGNNTIYDVEFTSSTTAYYIDNTAILKSTVGGTTWSTPTNQPSGGNLRSLYIEGSNTFIGNSSGKINYSINNATFSQTGTIGAGQEVKKMSVDLAGGKAVALIGDDIYFANGTANNFASFVWTELGSVKTEFNTDVFVDIHATDVNNIYAVTADGKVAYSTSGGSFSNGNVNWMEKSNLALSNSSIKSFTISSPTGTGIMVGNEGTVWSTADGGALWTNLSNSFKPLPLTSVAFDDNYPLEAFIVGDNGTFLHSEDKGISWKILNSGTSANLKDLGMDNNSGILVGDGVIAEVFSSSAPIITNTITNYKEIFYSPTKSVLLHDQGIHYGSSMAALNSSNLPVGELVNPNSIVMLGNEYSIAANDGKIYNSSNFGASWAKINDFIPPTLLSINKVNSNVLLVGGIGYYIGISTDGGNSWAEYVTPTSNDISLPNEYVRDLHFTDKNHGLIVSGDGRAFTYDSSRTPMWKACVLEVGGSLSTMNTGVGLYHIDMLNDNIGLITGKSNIYYTESGIEGPWKKVVNSSTTNYGFIGQMVDPDYGFVGGLSGKISVIERDPITNRLGITLKSTRVLNNNHVRAIHFVDRKRGYAVGSLDDLFVTRDGGDSWEPKGSILNGSPHIFVLGFFSSGKGYVGGYNGEFGFITDFSDYFSDRFYYDKLGRLVASQNAKQYNADDKTYSYTLYDELGRISEVGELLAATSQIESNYRKGLLEPVLFDAWISTASKNQISRTYYDNATTCNTDLEQQHLRSRVTTSTYQEFDNVEPCVYDYATHYSYDVHGNVKTLYQEFSDLTHLEQQFKRIDYEYDLISGNVMQVKYQAGMRDQFYHRYQYDADNRITAVLTSSNGLQWSNDASYEYYRHGPLKRTALGDWKVQGIDFAYTVQGWLKGINSNSLRSDRDMGRDATASANNNNYVAKDAVGYNLGYYQNDYTSIGSPAANFEASISGSYIANNMKNLYNGNIAYMTTTFIDDATNAAGPQAMIYKYDQLNRIKGAEAYTTMDVNGNSWGNSSLAYDKYKTEYNYDANGNLTRLARNDQNGDQMDVLKYKYHHKEYETIGVTNDWHGKNTNRLLAAQDSINNGTSGPDIKNGQVFDDDVLANNNYEYDAIGNLIKDEQEQIENIEWTVSGKVKAITRYVEEGVTKPDLEFFYDAQGNRVKKIVKPKQADGSIEDLVKWTETYYVRDAQGNILSTYSSAFSSTAEATEIEETLVQKELNLFGSDRLGVYNRAEPVAKGVINYTTTSNGSISKALVQAISLSEVEDENIDFRGKKNYEMKNHLGNVLATITDQKTPVVNTTTSTSIVFTEDFAEENWSFLGEEVEGELSQTTKMDVTLYDESGEVTRSLDYTADANCSYQYCFTMAEGFTQGSLYFRLYTGDFGQISEQLVLPGENCFTIDLAAVGNIGFYLADHANGGTFTITEASLSKTCTNGSLAYFEPVVTSRQDYYPFGMQMPGRSFSSGSQYRYGFNGKEKDDEVSGNGNSYDYGFRIYNPRIGKFLSVDPLTASFPWYTPYQYAGNTPIWAFDLDGLEEAFATDYVDKKGKYKRRIFLNPNAKPGDVGTIQFKYSDESSSSIVNADNKMLNLIARMKNSQKAYDEGSANEKTNAFIQTLEGPTTLEKPVLQRPRPVPPSPPNPAPPIAAPAVNVIIPPPPPPVAPKAALTSPVPDGAAVGWFTYIPGVTESPKQGGFESDMKELADWLKVNSEYNVTITQGDIGGSWDEKIIPVFGTNTINDRYNYMQSERGKALIGHGIDVNNRVNFEKGSLDDMGVSISVDN